MIQIKSGEKVLNNGQIHCMEKMKALERNSEWNFEHNYTTNLLARCESSDLW